MQYFPAFNTKLIAIITGGVIFAVITLIIVRLWRLLHGQLAVLEITPLFHSDQSSEAASQLLRAMHGIGLSRRLRERLLDFKPRFSVEIASTREQGIRYLVVIPANHAYVFETTLKAHMPGAVIRAVPDFLPKQANRNLKLLRFPLRAHFAFPLGAASYLGNDDALEYVMAAMTKQEPGELMSMQLVIVPMRSTTARRLHQRILDNEDVLRSLASRTSAFQGLTKLINALLFGIADVMTSAYHGTSKQQYAAAQKELTYQKQVAKHIKPVRTLSYFEHEVVASVSTKLAEPIFKAEVRFVIQAQSKTARIARQRSIVSALSLFDVPQYQGFRPPKINVAFLSRYYWLQVQRRLLFSNRNQLMSADELACLYHFPGSRTSTENIQRNLSRSLPAPISLKGGSGVDVILGQNDYHGSATAIGLTEAERQRHVYIIGGTGNGKTTMLLYSILQDINSGKGIAVLDPHGDLAEAILGHIPDDRVDDVIYLNPDDLAHPIGINLLELPPGLSGDELLREKDLITESTISVLRKIFSDDDTGGHRIEYVLRNAIQTALTLDNPTLFTIFRLLNDRKFRRSAVKNLGDEDLKNFWVNELGKAGEFQRVKMAAGITAKIGRFLFSASAKRMLEQERSSIDFSAILDEQKILICNFSKGLLGEDTSTLFGTTVLAKLQIASLRRARIQQSQRSSFYLYVDEFQNFATMSFVQMLSEARKYKLFLTMAEQSTAQQEQQRLVDIILANVGTVVCFRSGSPHDEQLLLPLFKPFITEGELSNLPAYTFYCRIAAMKAQEPMSGKTILLEKDPDVAVALRIKERSRQNYAIKLTAPVSKKLRDTPNTPPVEIPVLGKPI